MFNIKTSRCIGQASPKTMATIENVIAKVPYLTFRNMFERVKRPTYVNKSTNVTFSKLAFLHKDGHYAFVQFSSKMNGEPTNEELKAHPENYQILQFAVDEDTKKARRDAGLQEETYVLCHQHDQLEDVEFTDL